MATYVAFSMSVGVVCVCGRGGGFYFQKWQIYVHRLWEYVTSVLHQMNATTPQNNFFFPNNPLSPKRLSEFGAAIFKMRIRFSEALVTFWAFYMSHIRALNGYLNLHNKTNKFKYVRCVHHMLFITDMFRNSKSEISLITWFRDQFIPHSTHTPRSFILCVDDANGDAI